MMTDRYLTAPSAKATITVAALLLLAPCIQAQEVETSGNDRTPARAGDFTLKVETGVAFPLSVPQSDIFDTGGGQTVKGLWALNPNWDLGPSATYTTLPTKSGQSEAGTAWTFGGSVRFKRSHSAPDNDPLGALSPWLDVDALYVATGDLSRPGFAAAVGVAVPIGRARAVWLGPFVRYFQILEGTRTGFDDNDAKILSLGLSLEVGSPVGREMAVRPFEAEPAPVADLPTVDTVSSPDRDADGTLDAVDHCPDVAGPTDNWGCRVYEKLIVKEDKLELKEKLYFAWDQAVLQDVSFPVLDEVVQALKDNKNFRVQVEGHTSSDGEPEHNQMLSEARAQAVLDYLAAHGVERERLGSKGFSSSVPIDTNDTVEGRENNRRVEFVVYFIILDKGTNQL
jgi:outer membrane protein OmpA-like peptidoglycan-associated protein